MSETLNDHLPLSPDHNAERLAALKKLLPDLFSNDGRLNVDELKKVVDPALVSETERYDFRWYGKTKSKREAFTPSRAALVYDPARSVNPDKAGGNMIIEGENLEVLKLLTSAYRGRIKCIYIDGPYNTGKDFIYSDTFAEGQKPYWEQTGVTEGGVKMDTNTESDGRFHSNWLSATCAKLSRCFSELSKPKETNRKGDCPGLRTCGVNSATTSNARGCWKFRNFLAPRQCIQRRLKRQPK